MIVDGIDVPTWIYLLVWINLIFKEYWYALFPAIGIGAFIMSVKMFTMPLLTRNPAELVLILGPTRGKVLKVKSKVLPYFVFNKGLYWFDEPIPIGESLLHIYFEGINQPITNLIRNPDKEANIINIRDNDKQLVNHQVIIPPGIRSFTKNWVLLINDKDIKLQTQKESGMKGKQRYKIGLLKRIGIYQTMTKEVEAENSSTTAKAQYTLMTLQVVRQELGDVVTGTNFNSRYSFKMLKRVRDLEINWVKWLTGAFDWKIIIMVLLIIVAMVGIYFISQSFNPGPPPPGVNVGK